MYRQTPRHPVRSFRFWFLVLSCAAATTAWRMGWIPERKTAGPSSGAAETANEIPPVVPVQLNRPATSLLAKSSPATATAPPKGKSAAPVEVVDGQTEPESATSMIEPPVVTAALPPVSRTPQWERSQPVDAPSVQSPGGAVAPVAGSTPNAASPFGRAELEFVPAESVSRQQAASSADRAERFPGDPGMIQQVAAVEGEPGVRGATLLSGDTNFGVPPVQNVQIDWSAIDRMVQNGQDVEAHRILSSLYWERPDQRDQLSERINRTSQRIYFQPHPHYIDPYTVRSGDLLQNIAADYNISWQYLAKLNRVDPLRIQAGRDLKVILGPFGAVVDLRRFELTVHAHGYYVARFPIGVGKDGSTPVGEFVVQDKLEDPTYYGPDGVIAHDDPNNPLGEFWISLGDGYGIHGTVDESSVGRAASRGCLRLRNQDIADLYDLLTVGSQVVIRR